MMYLKSALKTGVPQLLTALVVPTETSLVVRSLDDWAQFPADSLNFDLLMFRATRSENFQGNIAHSEASQYF